MAVHPPFGKKGKGRIFSRTTSRATICFMLAVLRHFRDAGPTGNGKKGQWWDKTRYAIMKLGAKRRINRELAEGQEVLAHATGRTG